MKKTQKFLLLASLPLFVILLSGCASQPTKQTVQVPAEKNSAGSDFNSPNPALQNQTPAVAPLEPLPADDKQAIDNEIDNIDKDLKTTENAIDSTDLSNANLGL